MTRRIRLVSSVERYEGVRVIGAPENGRAIYITNSERSSWTCPKRGWFRHVEGLRTTARRRGIDYGTAWHDFLHDVHGYWFATDAPYPDDGETRCWACHGFGMVTEPPISACARCVGTGLGVVTRLRAKFAAEAKAAGDAGYPDDRDDLLRDAEILARAADGWLRVNGRAPPESYRLIGVEVAVARAVLVPGTTHPYTPETYLTVDSAGARLAATGEAANPPDGARVVTVRWPYYQIGRLDSVWQHRRTGAIYVAEWKSAVDPTDVARSLGVDPQTTGYCWLVQGAVENDAFVLPDGVARIAGVWFDAAYNGMQYDPESLKKGGLSVAKNRTVPSWRFSAAVTAMGLDPLVYDEHVAYLAAHVDPKLYVRDTIGIPEDDQDRYAEELYGFCVQHSAWRRAGARARTQVDINVAFPRQPVCRLTGGRCEFTGPCLADGEGVREKYEVKTGQRWTPEAVPGQGVIEWDPR